MMSAKETAQDSTVNGGENQEFVIIDMEPAMALQVEAVDIVAPGLPEIQNQDQVNLELGLPDTRELDENLSANQEMVDAIQVNVQDHAQAINIPEVAPNAAENGVNDGHGVGRPIDDILHYSSFIHSSESVRILNKSP